jgi:hypothetical protein
MHEVLDWFGHSHEVIVIHTVFMYYAFEIDSSLFFLEFFGGLSEVLWDVLDVYLSSLFIIEDRLIEFS